MTNLFTAGVTGSIGTATQPTSVATTSAVLNPEQVSTTVEVGLIALPAPETQPLPADDRAILETTEAISKVPSELVEQTSATDDLFTILGTTANDLCPW